MNFLWFLSEPLDTLMNRKPAIYPPGRVCRALHFFFIAASKRKASHQRESRLALHRMVIKSNRKKRRKFKPQRDAQTIPDDAWE
jgi:hypothetical protein